MTIDWENPPCRICGATRDPHARTLVDHRYRGEHQCSAMKNKPGLVPDEQCQSPARWYVDSKPMCSPHKGIATRGLDPFDVRLEKVRTTAW